jgi:Bardet-Biedl syndrome 9 protein
MSLFQAREWWATTSGDGEEYDNGCVCVANVDNDESGDEKIVTGSFQGTLRVFYPRQPDFRIEDLIMERELDAPIIQIEAGRFIPNSNQLGIAVLHPRKLVIYTLQAMGGGGSSASYFELQKSYEHSLGKGGEHFTAYNMCYGSFGGAYGRDLICVQSMDAQLQVFEQDSQAFTRQLRSLVPGPLCYAPKIDAIITATTKLQVECYKYQVLASSTAIQTKSNRDAGRGEEKADSASDSAAKQVKTDWMCNVGETVVEIRVGKLSKGLTGAQTDIIVLGEHSMFAINATGGTLRMQHRLGYFPSSSLLPPPIPPPSFHTLSSLHHHTLSPSPTHLLPLTSSNPSSSLPIYPSLSSSRYFPSCCVPFSAGPGSEQEESGPTKSSSASSATAQYSHLLVATHDSMLKVRARVEVHEVQPVYTVFLDPYNT